jgi:hypothetical protein
MVKFSLINDMQGTIRMKIERNGRPPILLTTEQIIQVEALAAVCTKSQMAAYFGVTEKTFRAIEKRQPEVFTAYRRGRARAVADIGSNLYQRALEGDIRAMQFYLKTQAGWSGRKRVELSRLEDTHQNLQWTVELVSVT